MFQALQTLLAPALLERLTLALNHVLAAEPVATQRLAAHAGRSIRLQFEGWPALLPAPPALAFRITPAGLFEWDPAEAADAALQVRLDASNPAALALRMAAGDRPPLEIQGDAALAADVHWLVDHLRWDAEADLARLIDPRAAHEVARFGAWCMQGLRTVLRNGADLATRLRPGAR